MPPNSQLPNPANSGQPLGANQTPVGSQPSESQPEAPKNPNSTQNLLLFSEIRDSMVVMADGSFRAVVVCKSINFDLMSSRERDGVEFSYQNFINSLNHPIQILIRSQRVDIGPYIERLVKVRQGQDNLLLGVLMDDYIDFIDILAQEANVMDKSFFVAIPYYPHGELSNVIEQSKGFFSKLFAKSPNKITRIDKNTYDKAKAEVKNRVDGVVAGLSQIGIRARQLNTKELGEIFYSFYNPDTAVHEPLVDFTNHTTTFVKKGTNQPNQTGGNS